MLRTCLASASLLVCTFASLAHSASVTLVNAGTDDRIASISGLTVSGTGALDGIYDLTFHYVSSYDALSALLAPESPITFTTSADAQVVMQAIVSAVNNFGDVTGQRTDDVRLPFGVAAGDVSYRLLTNGSLDNYSDWVASAVLDETLASNTLNEPDNALVTAARVAVPVPSTFTMLLTLMSGWGICRGIHASLRSRWL